MKLETVSGVDLDGRGERAVQVVEIGIDALDAAAIRPFWAAVLGYVDEPGRSGPWDGLVDPLGQGPSATRPAHHLAGPGRLGPGGPAEFFLDDLPDLAAAGPAPGHHGQHEGQHGEESANDGGVHGDLRGTPFGRQPGDGVKYAHRRIGEVTQNPAHSA